jgi:transglutaminase-like putative cysteine protease
MKTRVGDLGDTPWWAHAPVAATASLGAIGLGIAGQLEPRVVAWTVLVSVVSVVLSLSRRARPGDNHPGTERRARPDKTRGTGWFLALHAAVIGAGAAPYLFWAQGNGSSTTTMALVVVTSAVVGLLFGTRSGLTISVVSIAAMLAISLRSEPGTRVSFAGWSWEPAVPWWLAACITIMLLLSAAFIARLGLAELATTPNIPSAFAAPPSDKRGVGLFDTPSRSGLRSGLTITALCAAGALLLAPLLSPFTTGVRDSVAERLSGGSGAGGLLNGAAASSRFREGEGDAGDSSSVLGAEDSFTIDQFGATSTQEVLRVTYQLGAEPRPTPVRQALLKGQSFDRWDGRRWTSTAEVVRAVRSDQHTFDALAYPGRAQDFFVSTVEVRSGSTNLVFGASRILQVELPGAELLVREDESIVTSRRMGKGTKYQVVTVRHPYRDGGSDVALSSLADSPEELEAFGVQRNHLDVSTVSPRTLQLARELGADQTSIQGVVRSLETWLQGNVKYDFSVRHKGAGRNDVVDDFLFVTRAGWCEQVATATVMMLRANGIPARLATGYLPSELGPDGVMRVLGRDAHAWVEYYVPGRGWAQRDPTRVIDIAKLPPDTSETAASLSLAQVLVRVALAVLLVLVVVAVVRLFRRRQVRQVDPIDLAIRSIETFGADRARPRAHHETLTEYGVALTRHLGDDADALPLSSAVAVLERQRFDSASGRKDETAVCTEVQTAMQLLGERFPEPNQERRKKRSPRP